VETAHGRSKKLAKRLASLRMLAKLKELNITKLTVTKHKRSVAVNNGGGGEVLTNGGDAASTNGERKRVPRKKSKAVNYVKQFKASNNAAAVRLLSGAMLEHELNKEFLELFAREENFSIEFHRMSVKNTAKSRILLTLKLNPKLTVGGVGLNQEEAMQNACFNALELIIDLCNLPTQSQ